MAQAFPPTRLPALDRSDRPAQMPRRLLVGATLEVAEHHRCTVALGEPVDLLVEHSPQLVSHLGMSFRRPTPPRTVRAGDVGRPIFGHHDAVRKAT